MHDEGHIKHIDNICSAYDHLLLKSILCLSHIYKMWIFAVSNYKTKNVISHGHKFATD